MPRWRPGKPNRRRRVIIAGRDSLHDTVNQVGQEVTRRNLDIQPTLTQRAACHCLPLRVIVNHDVTFTCPSDLKADLERYAPLHSQAYRDKVDAMTLIPHIPEAFMARDRVFRKANAGADRGSGSSPRTFYRKATRERQSPSGTFLSRLKAVT